MTRQVIQVTEKRLLGSVRKAVQDYDMITAGDRIAAGVSGGKDSLCMLWALAKLKEFYPEAFELEAVTLDPGFENFDPEPVESFCSSLGVRHTVEHTLIGRIVKRRNEKNPCSMCANLRRGALNEAALRLGCNKVALGHNRDDVIETLLISLFYEGRIHTFSPVTWLDRTLIHVIRPLVYVEERDTKGFVKKHDIRVMPPLCSMEKATVRQQIKKLLDCMIKENRDVKNNIFGAIKRRNIDMWRET